MEVGLILMIHDGMIKSVMITMFLKKIKMKFASIQLFREVVK
jgi:hypothetical protein